MHTGEDEALTTGRDDGQRYALGGRSVGQGSQICDYDIAAFPESDIHHAVAIFDEGVVGQYLGHRRPVTGPEVRKKAFLCSTCSVFKSPRLRVQLLEVGERGVEVFLVE
jgi:hypothetical protein